MPAPSLWIALFLSPSRIPPSPACVEPSPFAHAAAGGGVPVRAPSRAVVAQCMWQYTPDLSLADDDSLLLDVGASLRAFGGPHALCRRIRRSLDALGSPARLGCAPTPRGAWLLARHEGPLARRALSPATLARRLGALPCTLLPAARPHREWLAGIGCLTLDTLQRLPRAGVRRRCGPALLASLDQALGTRPDPLVRLKAPAHVEAEAEPAAPTIQTDVLLRLAHGLLQQLCGWLTARQAAVSAIALRLHHPAGRHARPPTVIEIALADPATQADHLQHLLAERLARHPLAAPVERVALYATQLAARPGHSGTLFADPAALPAHHRELLERLTARLGAARVRAAQPVADHLPERANHWPPADSLPAACRPARRRAAAPRPPDPASPMAGERPFWLLARPLPLPVRGHRPVHGTPLRVLPGTERIESGWWQDRLQARDYVIAEDEHGQRYWLYRERRDDEAGWFLHGLFG